MIHIEKQFVGPPGSGNGGYVCGTLARYIPGPAEVTLRAPCPLETDLDVVEEAGETKLMHGDDLIAIAKPQMPDIMAPRPISFDQAVEASRHFRGWHDHALPCCFVCGIDNPEGRGLRLFAGPVNGDTEHVAAPWVPHKNHADEDGTIPAEIVWAALDCPGAFSVGVGQDSMMLLGRLNAQIFGAPKVGDACVIQGWKLKTDGRKNFVGTALYGDDSELLAVAAAVWITVDSL